VRDVPATAGVPGGRDRPGRTVRRLGRWDLREGQDHRLQAAARPPGPSGPGEL